MKQTLHLCFPLLYAATNISSDLSFIFPQLHNPLHSSSYNHKKHISPYHGFSNNKCTSFYEKVFQNTTVLAISQNTLVPGGWQKHYSATRTEPTDISNTRIKQVDITTFIFFIPEQKHHCAKEWVKSPIISTLLHDLPWLSVPFENSLLISPNGYQGAEPSVQPV